MAKRWWITLGLLKVLMGLGAVELLETDDVGYTGNSDVAFDNRGNAMAVWEQHDGTRQNIWANYFDGSSWGTAVLIENDNAGFARNPQIAFDKDGNAMAVWQQSDGTRDNIWANRFDGNIWGTAVLIESGEGRAFNPQVAFDGFGKAICVWSQRESDNNRTNVWANRFDGNWGSPMLIETDNAGSVGSPQIAFDNTGKAIVIWPQSDGDQTNIRSNRFDGTSWGNEVLVESDNAGDAFLPQIAFDKNGNAMAVWVKSDGNRKNIWANRFDGTAWATPVLIENDNAGDADDPQIAVDGKGNAIVVWQQSDGIRTSIWSNRFDGIEWGIAELVETDDTDRALNPQIANDPAGNAIAVWNQVDEIEYRVWANRFDGTRWGNSELIAPDPVYSDRPQVAVDDSGIAIVVWEQYDAAINIKSTRLE